MDWKRDIFIKQTKPIDLIATEILEAYPFKGDERVLLLGCNDRLLPIKIAEKLPQGLLVVIDTRQEMVDHMIKSCKDIANVHISLLDIQSFTFSDQFNLILSFDILQNIYSFKKILPKIRDHLLPGAKSILRFRLVSPLDHLQKLDKSKWHKVLKILPPSETKERDEIEMTFMSEPFSGIYFQDFIFSKAFTSVDNFALWFKNHLEKVPKLSDKNKDAITEDITKALYESENPIGPISIDLPYIHIECTR